MPDALPPVSLDSLEIGDVLFNLIENAAKYAAEGTEIRVLARQVATEVRVEVADRGAGVPPEDLPRLFDPFYRVDAARTTSEGHSGLGLRISRGLIRAHGGELTLTSTEGFGATAEITLPRLSA